MNDLMEEAHLQFLTDEQDPMGSFNPNTDKIVTIVQVDEDLGQDEEETITEPQQ